MTLIEQTPNQTQPAPQVQLRELMDKVHADLSILVSLAIRKPHASFKTEEAYDQYRRSLRYQCVPSELKQASDGLSRTTPGFAMNAKSLQAEGQQDWELSLFSPSDAMSLEGRAPTGRYVMKIVLHEEDQKGEQVPHKKVVVDCSDGNDDLGPRVQFWSEYGEASGQGIIEPSEVESSYPFRVITQIADQLEREANGLLKVV
jgi:hypothetical protein